MPKYKIDYQRTLQQQLDLGELILKTPHCSEGKSCNTCKYNRLCFFNLKFTTTLLNYQKRGLI